MFKSSLIIGAMAMLMVVSTELGAHAAGNMVTVMGSTALQPLVEQAANKFMAIKTDVKILVQGGGSGTGLTQVSQGGADIGDSDIYAEEKGGIDAKSLVDHKVCVVGFAAAVHKDVTIKSVTQKQLIDIFSGKITNWKDVGGPDRKIVIINRPKSSGTRATFKKYALKGTEEAAGISLTEDSSGTVKKTIAETPGAIGYLALSYLDKTIGELELDGVAATKANIMKGKYPVWSYEHMYTKGAPAGAVKEFLEYMTGSDVQKKLVPALGYIPISEMKVSR